MTAREALEKVLDAAGFPYAEGIYYGKEPRYCIYQELESRNTDFADDEPVEETTGFEVHYVCTDKTRDDTDAAYRRLRGLLRRNGFYVTGKKRMADKAKDYVKTIIYCNIPKGLEE